MADAAIAQLEETNPRIVNIPSVRGCILAAVVSFFIFVGDVYIDSLQHPSSTLEAGFLILGSPIYSAINCLVVLVPFTFIRKFFNRSPFTDIVACASICFATTFFFEVSLTWLFDGQHMYISRDRRSYETLLTLSLHEHWQLPLTRWFSSIFAWLFVDLWPWPKLKRRYVLATAVTILVLFLYGLSPSIVEYRAATIAGDRPYCIIVASKNAWEYDDVTRRSQLSYADMWAGTINPSSSLLMYTTNHAQLVLDNPREYMNWSYLAQNFVPEALVNYTSGLKNGEQISIMTTRICEPKPHFVDSLNW